MKTGIEKTLEVIAEAYGISTLETQNSDSEDFHELGVWTLRKMLEEAYNQGKKDAQK